MPVITKLVTLLATQITNTLLVIYWLLLLLVNSNGLITWYLSPGSYESQLTPYKKPTDRGLFICSSTLVVLLFRVISNYNFNCSLILLAFPLANRLDNSAPK